MARRNSFAVPLALVSLCLAVGLPACRRRQAGPPRDPDLPFAYLFDTRTPSATPLAARALERRSGWLRVPRDPASHAIAGDAALFNDQLAVVLRRGGAGAEVYHRTRRGLTRRGTFAPTDFDPSSSAGPAGRLPARLVALTTVENRLGAVEVEGAYETAGGGRVSMAFRLTPGAPFVEMRPREGAAALLFDEPIQYVVVPEFFGDDVVLDAASSGAPTVGIPAENTVVGLTGQGNRLVICAWESNEQHADMLVEDRSGTRAIRGCAIEGRQGKRVWAALVEFPGIWHARPIAPAEANTEVVLGWRPPFPARWRGNLVGADGVARSWLFRNTPEERTSGLGLDERPTACWFADTTRQGAPGRACLQVPPFGEPVKEGHPASGIGHRHRPEPRPPTPDAPHPTPEAGVAVPFVVYPIGAAAEGRSGGISATEVSRSILDIGPCEYSLLVEGLASGEVPWPDDVSAAVEGHFREGNVTAAEVSIRDTLSRMVQHMTDIEDRIEAYARFTEETRRSCAQGGLPVTTRGRGPAGEVGEAARALLETADDAGRRIARCRGTEPAPAHAARLADALLQLIGTHEPQTEARRLCAEVRALGSAQHYTLVTSRMGVRRIRERCRTIAADRPAAADFARGIQEAAERLLRRKAAPESRPAVDR